MATSKPLRKTPVGATIDFTPLLPPKVKTNTNFKRHLAQARKQSAKLRKALDSLETKMKGLETRERLGNFEIQDLMSRFNQAEALASSVLKKRDDAANSIIQKIG